MTLTLEQRLPTCTLCGAARFVERDEWGRRIICLSGHSRDIIAPPSFRPRTLPPDTGMARRRVVVRFRRRTVVA